MPSLIFYIGVGRVSSKSLSIGQASVDGMRELEPAKELNGLVVVRVLQDVNFHCQ